MKTNELYDIADKAGIEIDRFDLRRNRSVAIKYNDKLYIGLDVDVSGAEERVCLAHEIGHCETMSFYNIHSPFDIREKHERRADIWAIKAMIPYQSYIKAIKLGYTEIYTLAEYFGVTEDFMRKTVAYYSQKTKNART